MVIWIFQKVMPWVGLYFVAMTVIFFVIFFSRLIKERRYIKDISEVWEIAEKESSCINIIPLLLILFVCFVVDMIIDIRGMLKARKEARKED